jgi:adenylosuccinate synthase
LNLTKLDILDGLKEIKVAIAYKVNGEKLESFPGEMYSNPLGIFLTKNYTADLNALSQAEPVYETFPGWSSPTTKLTKFHELPAEAKSYIAFIEEFVGVKVDYVGVGPGREHMLTRTP